MRPVAPILRHNALTDDGAERRFLERRLTELARLRETSKPP